MGKTTTTTAKRAQDEARRGGRLKTKPKHLSAEIRRYLAHNGRRGGKAGKGSPARRAAAIRAAEARWKGRRKAASKTAAP